MSKRHIPQSAESGERLWWTTPDDPYPIKQPLRKDDENTGYTQVIYIKDSIRACDLCDKPAPALYECQVCGMIVCRYHQYHGKCASCPDDFVPVHE